MSVPALQRTVLDLVEEYEEKCAAVETEIEAFEAACARLEMASSVQGTYGGQVIARPFLHASTMRNVLLKSGWKAIYERLQIDRLASAKDKRLFDRTLEQPPELTFENAKATFGDYLMRPRHHILRGLAEVFADLDPAYKSHSRVKIGVKGLPKRVIIRNFTTHGSWGRDKFRDIINALAAYRGQPLMEYSEFSAISAAHDTGEDAVLDGRTYERQRQHGNPESYETKDRGVTVRKFGNGNAHVFFTPHTLLDINCALAEFYGEVLPDAEEEDAKPRQSTAISKDLQFYWSPPDVVERALDCAGIYSRTDYSGNAPRYRVLEPSCGDGRILDELKARGHLAFGIEVHPGRAAECRAKGHRVLTANFLEQPPKPEFDFVVMNPPFYGRHYAKHVRHALKFLKPDGILVSILPASAWYDHKEFVGDWTDLPPASFADAGTNIPTGILKMRIPVAQRIAA